MGQKIKGIIKHISAGRKDDREFAGVQLTSEDGYRIFKKTDNPYFQEMVAIAIAASSLGCVVTLEIDEAGNGREYVYRIAMTPAQFVIPD